MAQRKPRPEILTIDDRTRELLAAPVRERAIMRPKRVDPHTLPSMPYKAAPARVRHAASEFFL